MTLPNQTRKDRGPNARGIVTIAALAAIPLPLVAPNAQATYLLLGAIATLVVVTLTAVSTVDRWWYLQPIAVVIPLVLIGTTTKLFYVIFQDPSDPTIRKKLLPFGDLSIMSDGVLGMFLFVSVMSIAYKSNALRPMPLPVAVKLRGDFVETRLRLFALVLLGISSISLLLFIVETGALGGNVSNKRFTGLVGEDRGRAGSRSYLWWRGALLSRTAFLLLFASRLVRRSKGGNRRLDPLWIWTLLISCIGPIVANNRSGIAVFLIDAEIIATIILLKRRSTKRLLGGSVVVASMLTLLAVRSNADNTIGELASNSLFGRDLFDVTKLAHIMAIPNHQSLGGETLIGWIPALVPVQLFEDPPLWIGLGKYVFNTAYENPTGNVSGVPAGFPGELFLNFGWAGIIVGAAMFGVLLRAVWRAISPLLNRQHPLAVIVYALFCTHFVVFVLANDLGTGTTKFLLEALPVILVGRLCISRKSPVAVTEDPDDATRTDDTGDVPAQANRRRS